MNHYRKHIFSLRLVCGTILLLSPTIALSSSGGFPTPTDSMDALSQITGNPLTLLLLQVLTILLTARLFGKLFANIGQPTVVGEIIAGIFLGPSILGWLFPGFSNFLFPDYSLGNLQILSQIGLILFMFIVGMELDWKILKSKAKEAAIISQASIAVPFLMGLGVSFYLFRRFPPSTGEFLTFAVFIALSLSVTAFPVLARIVQERGISKTKSGVIAITSAAFNDLTAWSLLAVLIVIVKAGSFLAAISAAGLAIAYVLIMIFVLKPFLTKLGESHAGKETLTKSVVGLYLLILLTSSLVAEIIGIHALFGAFMAGLVMPENIRFRELLSGKIEDLAVVLLLPLFFVFTGLRTEIGLLNQGGQWLLAFGIILLAITGKVLGSAIPARLVGQSWRDSLIVGALMNTRGLMELVVLNIGYDLGLLSPELFVILVIMAIATTLLTGPGLHLIDKYLPSNGDQNTPDSDPGREFSILLAFGNPESGRAMLRLANSISPGTRDRPTITALHFSPLREIKLYNEDSLEEESFLAIKEEAEMLGVNITSVFKPSRDINREILTKASGGTYDLLIIGMGPVVLRGTILGSLIHLGSKLLTPGRLLNILRGREELFTKATLSERVRELTHKSKIPVGVFINNDLTNIERLFVPRFDKRGRKLSGLVSRIVSATGAEVIEKEFRKKNETGVHKMEGEVSQLPYPVNGNTLTIVSVENWPQYERIMAGTVEFKSGPSVLIVKM